MYDILFICGRGRFSEVAKLDIIKGIDVISIRTRGHQCYTQSDRLAFIFDKIRQHQNIKILIENPLHITTTEAAVIEFCKAEGKYLDIFTERYNIHEVVKDGDYAYNQ